MPRSESCTSAVGVRAEYGSGVIMSAVCCPSGSLRPSAALQSLDLMFSITITTVPSSRSETSMARCVRVGVQSSNEPTIKPSATAYLMILFAPKCLELVTFARRIPCLLPQGLQDCFVTAYFAALACMATFDTTLWKGKVLRRFSATRCR